MTINFPLDMNSTIHRRDFLKRTAAAGVGLGVSRLLIDPARGADERPLNIAVAGTNSRGLFLIDCAARAKNVRISHIADVDQRAIDKGLQAAAKHQKEAPKGVKDFRRVLEDKTVDALMIATPDHWHAPMAIMALEAGKHVYVEKPCSHNPHEGELLVAAVAKYKRVFQMGNQRRSFPQLQEAIKQIHDGVIGKAYSAKAWYANNRKSIGHGQPAPVPDTLDYDLWQGPAPRHAYADNLVPYNWHWFWRYGTGEALNNGTHEVDVARWALGVDFPKTVSSGGGRYAFQDDWETPDTQTISWDFAEGKSIAWEGRSCNNYPVEGLDRATIVYGTGGTALLNGNNYILYDNKHQIIKEVKAGQKNDAADLLSSTGIDLDTLHVLDFLDAIRTGGKTNSPVEEAHCSVALLHLGNIAWRVGRTLHCDHADGHINGDPEAAKLWQRDYEPGWEPKV